MKSLFYSFFILSLLSFSLLTSCEWNGNDDDNYVEIEKPQENIDLKVDLAGVNPEEVIQIVNRSWLSYTLYTGGHDLITQTYYLDGKELSNYSWNSIYIDGFAQDGKIHELKVVMTLKTNTGSLAEMLQAEFYVGEYTFKIKIIGENQQYDFKIKQSLSENKYLRLDWSDLQDIDIERYELYIDNRQAPEVIMTNLNDTYFIDKTYYYGYRLYTIKAYPKNSFNIQPIEAHYYAQYNVFTDEHIKTEMTSKSIKITWNNPNPFPVKYALYLNNDKDLIYSPQAGNNYMEIPRPYFPIGKYFSGDLLLQPVETNIEEYFPSVRFNIRDKSTSEEWFNSQLYDPISKTIVSLKGNQFFKFDPSKDMKLVKEGTISGDLIVERSLQFSKSGKVALFAQHQQKSGIYVFKNSDFSNILYSFDVGASEFSISDTHLYYVKADTLYAMNMETQLIESKQCLYFNPASYNMLIEVSRDGKYMILTLRGGSSAYCYRIYENTSKQLNLIEEKYGTFSDIFFNPTDESQLFFQDAQRVYHIIDRSTLKKVKTLQNKGYLYTDPYTMNRLCFEYESQGNLWLTVYDNTFEKLLYKVELRQWSPKIGDYLLVNNILYSNIVLDSNFSYMDISDSINQK